MSRAFDGELAGALGADLTELAGEGVAEPLGERGTGRLGVGVADGADGAGGAGAELAVPELAGKRSLSRQGNESTRPRPGF